MAEKSYKERYNEIYRKFPDELYEVKNKISCEIDYEFIEPYYIKDTTYYKCVDYGRILSKVKWPDEKMQVKLDKSDFSKTDDAVPFLLPGVVIEITQNDKGQNVMWLSDDESIWNDPNDYDQLLHIKQTKNVQHSIIAIEMFPERDQEGYSIGSLKSIRPGTRVMIVGFMLETTQNDNWLRVCFTDVKKCSPKVSTMHEYYDVYLDITYRMITKNEYYEKFFVFAKFEDNKLADYLNRSESGSNYSSDGNSGGCYIATCVYGSYDCPEVWTLRRFRDDMLATSWFGRGFIRAYYKISPTLVKLFGETKWFKNIWRSKLDAMVNHLQIKGVESTPYKDK